MQGSGTIYDIEKRKNEGGKQLSDRERRRDAVDVFVVTATAGGEAVDAIFGRLNIAAVPFHLVFNKKDLIDEERVEEWREKMQKWVTIPSLSPSRLGMASMRS